MLKDTVAVKPESGSYQNYSMDDADEAKALKNH